MNLLLTNKGNSEFEIFSLATIKQYIEKPLTNNYTETAPLTA
jgi:hypothetical protein